MEFFEIRVFLGGKISTLNLKIIKTYEFIGKPRNCGRSRLLSAGKRYFSGGWYTVDNMYYR